MKNVLSLPLFIALAIGLAACSNGNGGSGSSQTPKATQHPRNSNAPESEGGIDSSGGDLQGITQAQFEELVKKLPKESHRWLRRLEILHTEKDIEIHELAELFKGPSIYQAIRKIRYHVSSTSCQGDGDHKDGSVNLQTQEICLSYPPFQKMRIGEAEAQLQLLALHEISHLRGMKEAAAQALQKKVGQLKYDLFNFKFSANEYSQTPTQMVSGNWKLTLGKAAEAAIPLVLNRKQETCSQKNSVLAELERSHDFNYVPASLKRLKFAAEVREWFDEACKESGTPSYQQRQAALDKMASILQKGRAIGQLLGEYLYFDSCHDWRCSNDSMVTADHAMARAYASLSESPENLPTTDPRNVSCQMIDSETNKEVLRWTTESQNAVMSFAGYQIPVSTQLMPGSESSKAVTAFLLFQDTGKGYFEFLLKGSSSWMANSLFGLRVLLQKTVSDQVEIPLELHRSSAPVDGADSELLARLTLRCKIY